MVLDKSKSIKERNLQTAINFLGDLAKTFNPAPDEDHFGFITFNNEANLTFSFADSQYHDKDKLLKKIASESNKTHHKTRTDSALKKARDELFTVAGGDRPEKPDVLILLTDGKPDNMQKTREVAEDIEVSTVQLLMITFILHSKFPRE